MKLILSITLASSLCIACNAGKDKAATTNNTITDTAKTNTVTSTDPVQQTGAISDTIPVPANRLIVPGKSIGLTSLDQKIEEATKHLGPPASEDAAMGGKELDIWYSKPVIHGTDTVINETDIFFTSNMNVEGSDQTTRVKHIRITSGFFATAQHIHNGSSHDSIQMNFPGIKKIAVYISPKTKKQVTIYDDSKSGIAFEIDDQHKCVGITVHKPGDMAYETYNSLFGDVKFDQ
jgi:hypothetical protein